jgi:glycosyltransferase involved in cell wall biosynthesis
MSDTTGQTVGISVVLPVKDEEASLPQVHQELKASLDKTGKPYEIIFVDDGSSDSSPEILKKIASTDSCARAVIFSRNFGQTAALSAGFAAATGEYVITMDADLQNDPADIPRLIERAEQGVDVVSGWRKRRMDPWLTRRLPSHMANRLISAITGVRLHDYGCTMKLYRRKMLDGVSLYGEMHRFLPAVVSWRGARIAEVEVNHRSRQFGHSKYNLGRTFKVLLDLVTVKFLGSYSTKPIYFFGMVGLLCFVATLISGSVMAYEKLYRHISMIQSPLLHLSAMLLVLGVQFIMMGLLAEIGVRTYHESQAKPTYVVRDRIKLPEEPRR